MTVADQAHDTATGAPRQATYTHLQREVSRLVDAVREARAGVEDAIARAMQRLR